MRGNITMVRRKRILSRARSTYAERGRCMCAAYLIQFGNIMPIERINDYREDMKLSGLAGRVNCHYPLFPTSARDRARALKRERETERERPPAGF